MAVKNLGEFAHDTVTAMTVKRDPCERGKNCLVSESDPASVEAEFGTEVCRRLFAYPFEVLVQTSTGNVWIELDDPDAD